MRKIMIIFSAIIIILVIFLTANQTFATAPLLIYIDPGHGGKDGGATFGGIKESDLNLSIAQKLKEVLENYGYNCLMTRDGDYDLASDPDNRKRTDIRKRVELINRSDCDLFISIHMNSFADSYYRGGQAFYTNRSEKNILLAKHIQDSFISYLQNTDRQIKKIDKIYLLDNVNKIGCLIECGFLSNPEELRLLNTNEYQTKVAYAIFYGIKNYLDI